MSNEMREEFETIYEQHLKKANKPYGKNRGVWRPLHRREVIDLMQAATAAAEAKYLPVLEKLVGEMKVRHEMIDRALSGIERASRFSNDAVISNTAFIRGFQKQIAGILAEAEQSLAAPLVGV